MNVGFTKTNIQSLLIHKPTRVGSVSVKCKYSLEEWKVIITL